MPGGSTGIIGGSAELGGSNRVPISSTPLDQDYRCERHGTEHEQIGIVGKAAVDKAHRVHTRPDAPSVSPPFPEPKRSNHAARRTKTSGQAPAANRVAGY